MVSRHRLYVSSPGYWFSAMTLAAFIWTSLTGIILLFYYQPSDPYGSTTYIISRIPLGPLVYSTHLYGAYIMIIATYLHGIYEFYRGIYRRTWIQWVIGVLLFALTLGVSFIGYSMVGDVLAVNAVNVGEGVLSSLGLSDLIPVFFGTGQPTTLYIRLLGWHIAVSAAIALLMLAHMPISPNGRGVNRPLSGLDVVLLWRENTTSFLIVLLATWGIILTIPSALALPGVVNKVPVLLSPYPGPSPTSPRAGSMLAYPPWFFLYLYKLMDLPFGLTTDSLMGIVIPMLVLLTIPALHRLGLPDRWLNAIFTLGIVWLIEFSIWGALQPGIPITTAQYIEVTVPTAVVVFTASYLAGTWKIPILKLPKVRLSNLHMEYLCYIASMASIFLAVESLLMNQQWQNTGILMGSSLISLSLAVLTYVHIS